MVFVFGLSLLFLFLIFISKNSDYSVFDNIRISFVKTFILISCLIVAFTEFLSFFNMINYKNILIFWMIICLILVIILLKNCEKLKIFFIKLKNINLYIKKNYFIVLCFTIVFLLLPLIFIAYYYPPNTGDSLGYHLPRIEHWIKNHNVNHYPVSDIRQLFCQVLPEFIILHLNLLSKSDFFANYVQFFAMIGSVCLVTLLIKFLSLNYKFQILSALLTISISMGILQSTSTQTDYVGSFFLLSAIYFILLFFKNNNFNNIIFSALALSLGFFAKLTIAIFSFPFFIWFFVLIVTKYKKYFFKITGIFVLVFILINGLFYYRNYRFTGNIFGGSEVSAMMQNQKNECTLFYFQHYKKFIITFGISFG